MRNTPWLRNFVSQWWKVVDRFFFIPFLFIYIVHKLMRITTFITPLSLELSSVIKMLLIFYMIPIKNVITMEKKRLEISEKKLLSWIVML